MESEDRVWFKSYDKGVPRTLDIPDVTLPARLKLTAERFGERAALRFMDWSASYAELFRGASRFASVLEERGIGEGDRVAMLFPNTPQQVIAYYGAMMAGSVVVQLNPLGSEHDMARALADSRAKALVALDVLLGKFPGGLADSRLDHVFIARIGEVLPPLLKAGLRLKSLLGRVALPPKGTGEDFGEAIRRVRPVAERLYPGMDALALLQYTGGTTGDPRAAMLTQRNLVANTEQCRAWLGVGEEAADVSLLAIPFFHVYGMTVGMNLAVRNAQTMVLHAKFDADQIMKSIQKHRATIFPGIQMFYQAINSHPRAASYDLSSVRACLSGAGPLMPEVQESFERLTGGKVREGYGLSEASPVTHCNPIEGERRVGSIGLPLPSTDARIMAIDSGSREAGAGEKGELTVRGPQVMSGYWNRDDETRQALRDGWLMTGDIATMDKDGFFRIVDRKKEMIISGGENIYPRHVEEVLFQHPSVHDAAVVGVPDLKFGEKVKAFVVLKKGRREGADELADFCRSRLSRVQVPRVIEFRNELPRTRIGKLLRRVLLEEERKKPV